MATPPTFFAHRLGTNYCPGDHEVLQIKGILQNITSELDEVDEEMNQTYAGISRLHYKGATLDSKRARIVYEYRMKDYQALLSPIRRVPPEILSEIFLHTLPDAHPPVMSRYEPPLLLTHICGHWRRSAHSVPRLWNSLHLYFPTPYTLNIKNSMPPTNRERNLYRRVCVGRIEAMETWFGRSKSFPLDISVFDEGQMLASDMIHIRMMMIDTLLRVRHRWRDITLHLYAPDLQRITSINPDRTPMLRRLSLQTSFNAAQIDIEGYRVKGGYRVWDAKAIPAAPNLRHLSILSLSETLHHEYTYWSKLETLDIRSPAWTTRPFLTTSDLALILRAASSLVVGRFYIGSAFSHADKPFTSPRLSSLTLIAGDDQVNITELVALMNAPRLTDVQLYLRGGVGGAIGSAGLHEFMVKFGASIRTLTFQATFNEEILPLYWLAHCQALTTFRYVCNPAAAHVPAFVFNDALFERLTIYGDLPLPSLKHLVIQPAIPVSDASLLRFIEQRRSSKEKQDRLESLKLSIHRPANDVFHADLECLDMTGFDLSLRYAEDERPAVPSIQMGSASTGLDVLFGLT